MAKNTEIIALNKTIILHDKLVMGEAVCGPLAEARAEDVTGYECHSVRGVVAQIVSLLLLL